jgi:predicted secreted protein
MFSRDRCIRNLALVALMTLIFGAAPLFAGDVAFFLNLGFSRDSSVFMFGQYGIDEESSLPYAESYLVDVAENEFIPGGTAQILADTPAVPGQDGIGALFNLTRQQHEVAQQYEIDHLNMGRLVYLYINGSEPKREISFRDFNTGTRYTLSLVQSVRGSEDEPEAAFHINLNAEKTDGQREARTIGLPNYYRSDINNYNIKQVLLSPDETSVIIVVEKILDYDGGRYLRYMVETARLYD